MYVTVNEKGVSDNFNPEAGNIVMYSAMRNIDSKLSFKNFSIKYVMDGSEIYRLKEHDYLLKTGEYLLCNAHCEGNVVIESKTPVKGICIDVESTILSEVVASYKAPDTAVLDLGIDRFFNSNEFMEQQFQSNASNLGNQLKLLHAVLEKKPFAPYEFDKDFYYRLAEGILSDYIPVFKQFQSVRCVKSATKRDLLRRLSKGKSFIDEHFLLDIDILSASVEANISQYHFFRLFKTVYGISPYQYLKEKRLTRARELLSSQYIPVGQLAQEVGYSDIFSFSKAYKLYFGYSPSKY